MAILFLLLAWLIASHRLDGIIAALAKGVWAVIGPIAGLIAAMVRVFSSALSHVTASARQRIREATNRLLLVGYDGLRLIAYLAIEFVRGLLSGADEEEVDDEDTEQEDDDGAQDECTYASACALLGLSERCERDALIKAYRLAIRTAHPDRGGSTQQAQAINKARARIARHNGWKI